MIDAKYAERVATLLEKTADYLEADEQSKLAAVANHKDATAKQIVAQVMSVLGDQLDPKTAQALADNETRLNVLNMLQEKAAELGGPAPTQKPGTEKVAAEKTAQRLREESKQADREFADWALNG